MAELDSQETDLQKGRRQIGCRQPPARECYWEAVQEFGVGESGPVSAPRINSRLSCLKVEYVFSPRLVKFFFIHSASADDSRKRLYRVYPRFLELSKVLPES